MATAIVVMLLIATPCQATNQISEGQKKNFFELLKQLPRDGEFYTEEGIKKAAPHLPVLFALTEKDLESYDIYAFLAVSRGLCDQKDERNYAVRHFAEIQHPTLKLSWAAMLFDAGAASDEIVRFLKDALMNEQQAKLLSAMKGPTFEDLKRRVASHRAAKK